MKKLFFYLCLFCALFFAACKKDANNSSINGTWELRRSVSGLDGKLSTYPKENGNHYTFSGNNYEYFSAAQLSKSGTYKLVTEQQLTLQKPSTRIIFDDVTDTRLFISREEGLLWISIDAYDAGSLGYERIR
ncbi:MAG: hypothetical protein INR69_20685 [Mucilaginibacter polytrichastri]|nr:hypothetical protein [Mucilaginibacter polytrichastri]